MTARRKIDRLKARVEAEAAASEARECRVCGWGVPLGPGEQRAVRQILVCRDGKPEPQPSVCPACGRTPPDDEIVVVVETVVTSRADLAPSPPAPGGGALDAADGLPGFDLPADPPD
jgi:hypothetical protein